MRRQLVIMMLFPITLCIWLLGWILFYLGSQTGQCNQHSHTAHASGCEEVETAILLEETTH